MIFGSGGLYDMCGGWMALCTLLCIPMNRIEIYCLSEGLNA